MQDAKEEVRAKLNIEDIIGEYVQLKRAGRSFKGLSPFSGEKTPSFFVSPDKNIWHDFSSNKGGDIFAFVMEVEGMDFRQALEHLARKAGVDLSLYENKGSQELAKKKKKLLEANRLAASFYQQNLLKNNHAIEYVFKARKLNKQVVQDFLLGYAPDSGDALINALTKKGFTKRELSDAGLTNRFGGDMFRGRMMVPLMDASGQVVGFTGRIMADIKNAPKYLNTSQTLLYDKGRHVFGLSQAKAAIREHDMAVIVEGNLDVVSSHQAGVKYVVATAGTAMTEYHLRALKRLTGNIVLAFDGDKAGIAATERAIEIAGHLDISLSIVSLPDGAKDPDELIQQNVDLWKAAIVDAKPAVDWILEQYSARVDMTSAAGKRQFTSASLKVVSMLPDPVEKEHYEQKIAKMTDTTLATVRQKLDKQEKPVQKILKPTKNEPAVKPSEYEVHQDDLLAAAIIDTQSQDAFAHMNLDIFTGEERRAVARYIANHPGKALTDTPPELQKLDTYVKILLLRAEGRYADIDPSDRVYETARLIRQIEHEHKKQQQLDLINQLRDAESAGDESKANELRVTLNSLIKELSRGKR